MTVHNGIPCEGSFVDHHYQAEEPRVPFGTYTSNGWRVDSAINQTRAEGLSNRTTRVFLKRPNTFDSMFRASVKRSPSAEAVVCGERRISYRDLDDLVERAACGFVAAGLQIGDRIAVMLDNRLEYLVAILACVRAGGVAVPLGTRLGPSDIAHIIENSRPIFAVTASECRSRFPAFSSLKWVFVVDDHEGSESFATLCLVTPARLPELDPGSTMMIIYTSGTTGKPKGVCLTHINFVHTCLHYLYALAIDRPQRSLLAIPATHIAGFGPLVSVTLACSGTIVMLREFKAVRAIETIEREKITYAVLVPAMYQLFALDTSLQERDLSTWCYGIYGGAIMPAAVIERFAAGFPQLRMINAYGATETCAVCTIMPPELTASAPSSVGVPLECTDIKIIDANGVEAEPGQPGEVWIKGPNVSPGYWEDADATTQAFHNGYWKSGDIGSRDERGLLYIHDRLKDMINRAGYKVFSAEVENALMAHPAVTDCAVVGVPDKILGERTFAFVQRSHAALDEATLSSYLAARIADYKVPDFWLVADEPVPRNQNGKVQKPQIRQIALELISGEPHGSSCAHSRTKD